MKTPEKIYIHSKSPKLYSNIDNPNRPWAAYEHPLTDKYEEYIRSDIAKEFALQFSKQVIDAKVDLYVGDRKDLSIDELFTEFINSKSK